MNGSTTYHGPGAGRRGWTPSVAGAVGWRIAVLLAALLLLALAGCSRGSGAAGGGAAGEPVATVTVEDAGSSILTNGFVVPKGESVKVSLVNRRTATVTVELWKVGADRRVPQARPADVPAVYSAQLGAGESRVVEVTFADPGDYGSGAVPARAASGGLGVVGGTISVE